MSDRDPKPDNVKLDVDLVVPADQADAFDDVVLAWDDGKTARAGQLAHRSGLLELLDAAEGGAFDVVAVLDVDRLTRSEDHIERSPRTRSTTAGRHRRRPHRWRASGWRAGSRRCRAP